MGGGRDKNGAPIYKRVNGKYVRVTSYKDDEKRAEHEEDVNAANMLRKYWDEYDFGSYRIRPMTRLLERAGFTREEYNEASLKDERAAILRKIEQRLNVNLNSEKIDEVETQIRAAREASYTKEQKEAQKAVKDMMDAMKEVRQIRAKNPWTDTTPQSYRFNQARQKILDFAFRESPSWQSKFRGLNSTASKQEKLELREELESILGVSTPDEFWE